MCGVSYATLSDFEQTVTEKKVIYTKTSDSSYASLEIMDPIVNIATTKEYAQHVMDSYQGWDLKPVMDLRGFSFKYVDNAPCSGLLSYFDGRSYLLFLSCGSLESQELTEIFKNANEVLKISDMLKLQAKPNLY